MEKSNENCCGEKELRTRGMTTYLSREEDILGSNLGAGRWRQIEQASTLKTLHVSHGNDTECQIGWKQKRRSACVARGGPAVAFFELKNM